MDMTGTRAVPAPAERVWKALNDPETLKSCIPGCESIEPDGEHAYRMAMAAKVGPVSARFTGTMRLTDIDAPRAYTLHFDGSAGAAGFVNGQARVTLTPEGTGATTLTYAANARVGGKIAQLGSRLINGAAEKLTGDFFTRFVTVLSPPVELPPRRERHLITYAVIVAVIVAVLVFLYLRGRGS
jgi:uncharacterized protein